MKLARLVPCLVTAASVVLTSCGGAASTAPTTPTPVPSTPPTPPNPCVPQNSPVGCVVTISGLPNLAVGTTTVWSASLRNVGANRIVSAGPPLWESDNPRVATVHPVSGEVRGVGPGTATIWATIVEPSQSLTYWDGRPVTVGIPGPFDGEWSGGNVFMTVRFGVVTRFVLARVSVPLNNGGTCGLINVGPTVNAPITNGSFSSGSLSGTFTGTSQVTGRYSSFTVGGAQCNASGTATVPGGSFTASKP